MGQIIEVCTGSQGIAANTCNTAASGDHTTAGAGWTAATVGEVSWAASQLNEPVTSFALSRS